MDFQLFSKISALPGASGREELLRSEIIRIVSPYVDEVREDAFGNVIALSKAEAGDKKPKKLMLAAHMDEVAMRVKYIEAGGFLRFVLTGGIDPRTLLSQRVIIQTENDGALLGVIGAKPAHYLTAADKTSAPTAESLFIDTGFGPKAREIFTIGDPVTLERTAVEFGLNMFCSKAIDDRAGVCILIEALKKLPKKHKADIYFVFTAQEEFGLIGAQVSSFALKPDIALAVDTTGALDMPGIAPQDYVLEMGKGIGITLVDSSTIADYKLGKYLQKICKRENIAFQLRVAARGGNDAKVMQRSAEGIPVCALSLPVRYIHSNVECANKKDFDSAVALVSKFAVEFAKDGLK